MIGNACVDVVVGVVVGPGDGKIKDEDKIMCVPVELGVTEPKHV